MLRANRFHAGQSQPGSDPPRLKVDHAHPGGDVTVIRPAFMKMMCDEQSAAVGRDRQRDRLTAGGNVHAGAARQVIQAHAVCQIGCRRRASYRRV